MKLSIVIDGLRASNGYIRHRLGQVGPLLGILWLYLLLEMLISSQIAQSRTIAAGIVLGIMNVLQWLLEMVTTFVISLRCHRWLSGNPNKVSSQGRTQMVGLFLATLAMIGALHALMPFLVGAAFKILGKGNIPNVNKAGSMIVATCGYIAETMLFFFVWPILIVEKTGAFRNIGITLRYLRRNIEVVLPSIGYFGLTMLKIAIRPHLNTLLNRTGSTILLIIASMYLSIYQMATFHILKNGGRSCRESHNNSLEPTPIPWSWFVGRPSGKAVAAVLMRRGGSAPCYGAQSSAQCRYLVP